MRYTCQVLRGVFAREQALSGGGYFQLGLFCLLRKRSALYQMSDLYRLTEKKNFSSGKKTWKTLVTWRVPCGDPVACWELRCVPSSEGGLPAHPASNQGRVNRTAVQR